MSGLFGDLDHAIAQAELKRRQRRAVVASLSAGAAVLVLAAGVLTTTRDDDRIPRPAPQAAPQPTPTDSTSAATEWPGPIRSGVTLRVVDDEQLGPSGNPWRGWTDPPDSAIGQIDIGLLAGWGLQLREDSQLEAWLDRAGRIVRYGLVVDTDGDRAPDCQLELSTRATRHGTSSSRGPSWRVLLRNLDTGETDERVGPPYGYPFEFGFPASDGTVLPSRQHPSLYFEFLGEWQPPCAAQSGRTHWYAYTSLTENGRVTAWDFAPDEAWLQTLPGLDVGFGGRIARTEWGRGLPLPHGP